MGWINEAERKIWGKTVAVSRKRDRQVGGTDCGSYIYIYMQDGLKKLGVGERKFQMKPVVRERGKYADRARLPTEKVMWGERASAMSKRERERAF